MLTQTLILREPLLLQILAQERVLRVLCLYLPSLPLRLARVNVQLYEKLNDDNIACILTEVFEELGMFQANPFDVARDGDLERIWLLLVHGVDSNIVGDVRSSSYLRICRCPLILGRRNAAPSSSKKRQRSAGTFTPGPWSISSAQRR